MCNLQTSWGIPPARVVGKGPSRGIMQCMETNQLIGLVLMGVAVIEIAVWRLLGSRPQLARVQPMLIGASVVMAVVGALLYLMG